MSAPGDCVTIGINVKNRKLRSLLDSGAGKSVIDRGTLETLGEDHKIVKDNSIQLTNASNNVMDVGGKCTIRFAIPKLGKTLDHEFVVLNVKTYKTLLLGRDFFRKMGPVTIDVEKSRIKIGGRWIKGDKSNRRIRVRARQKLTLPARSEHFVCVNSEIGTAMLDYEFKPAVFFPSGVYLTNAQVRPDQNGDFIVAILNTNEHEVTLKTRTHIGNLVPSQVNRVCRVDTSPKVEPVKKVEYGENLNAEQKDQMKEIVERRPGLFTRDPKKPKITPVIKHPIDTGEERPAYAKPRRMPPAMEKEVKENVEEMRRNNIIRPSESPWNCPIILLKKIGKSRFVSDFRELNKKTKSDTYPLPNIKDCVERMEGTKFWTTLDAASAYWSVELEEKDREKTAFSVPQGKFEFNVMTFGLRNAGATYQRMMDIVLSGLPPDRVLAYLDDIIIYSKNFEDHKRDVDSVLSKLEAADISLRPEKCTFGSNKVNFLGYFMNEEGIRPQKSLVDAIQDFTRPRTKKEVRRFLGTVGFYRDFIKNFAEISTPLRNLTKDTAKFEWTDGCQKTFEYLKHRLTEYPVLAFPITNKPFIVEVDASKFAVGGVLHQEQRDGTIRPVSYCSYALSPPQQNWEPYSQETFALVLAVRKWHPYLFGNRFTFRSDHNPLKNIRSKKDPRGKIANWLMELEEYDYEIEHIPGKNNVVADSLSRSGTSSEPPASRLEEFVNAVSDEFKEQLRTAQAEDIVVQRAIGDLSAFGHVKAGRLKRVSKQLRMEGDILTKSGRPVIPSSMHDYVVNEFHRVGNVKSHFGVEKTYDILRARFYWPNMFATVQNLLSTCKICQQCKSDPKQPKAPLVPLITPSRPMEFISTDIAYMEADDEGFRYILLIGCVFSKFVNAVPLKTQTAEDIVGAVNKDWIHFHGAPRYALSDKGSNFDGTTFTDVCKSLQIEKRRTSGYHAQGNGFAERSIRNVREILRTALLEKGLPHKLWRQILSSTIFALNSSKSKATNCTPYEVVFGRKPVLPIDIMFDSAVPGISSASPIEYLSDLKVQLLENINHATKFLGISREKMVNQYNKNLHTITYSLKDKVWLHKVTFKKGENAKLSPRKTGPWTIVKVYPNGVNFKIEDAAGNLQVVHHNRMSPVKEAPLDDSSESDSDETEYADDDSADGAEADGAEELNPNEPPATRYPARHRQQRQIPGAIPWDSIRLER